MSYNKIVLYFYKKGIFNNDLYFKNFNFCSCFLTGNISCGDIFLFQLIFSYFNFYVFDFKHRIYGCGSAIASISLSSFYLLNKFYYQIIYLNDFLLSKKLNLPSIKFHCSVFSQNTIASCLFIFKNDFIFFFF